MKSNIYICSRCNTLLIISSDKVFFKYYDTYDPCDNSIPFQNCTCVSEPRNLINYVDKLNKKEVVMCKLLYNK